MGQQKTIAQRVKKEILRPFRKIIGEGGGKYPYER